MGSEWKQTTIGEEATLQRGFDITRKQQSHGKVPVVSSGGISSYHNVAKQSGPGVVMGRKGSLGTVFFLAEEYWPHDTTLWVKDFHGNDERFVYYFFKDLAAHLLSMDVGAANPTLNRNHVHPMEIRWPPLPEQKAIAHILGTLDDKIGLNRRMNATLEGMAQALFKSWFVDFDPVIDNILVKNMANGASLEPSPNLSQGERDFAADNASSSPTGRSKDEGSIFDGIPDELAARAEVRRQALANGTTNREAAKPFPDSFQETEDMGWIPEGWSIQKISDVANLTWGDTKVTKKAYTVEGYTAYSAKGPDGFLSYYDFDKVGIVLSAIGSNSGQSFLAHGKWSCIKNTIRLWAEESDEITFYLYHVASTPLFWPLRGSAQPFISQTDARNCRLLFPKVEITREFGSMVAELYRKAWDNESRNITLTKLRDTLLPKLISGELRVANQEQLKA
jgi:type I restriction enzyme S subunit